MNPSPRRVSARLVLQVDEPARLTLQLAVDAERSEPVTESLQVVHDHRGSVDVGAVSLPDGARAHVLNAAPGRLEINYQAVIVDALRPPPVSESQRVVYLRPSRYAESDRLAPIAQAEFAGIADPAELLPAVSTWVGERLNYVPGSSGPTDSAVDTMLQRQGVCRDYTHLTIALLRALDVPARFVAVYAPGLSPMDFHAVVEAAVGDVWRVADATLLAPRSSMVRIGTGRDAADTAFLSSYGGRVELVEYEVIATIDGDLPTDDAAELVSLQ